VSNLLAAHGPLLDGILAHVNGLLDSVVIAVEAAAAHQTDCPTSTFEVKEQFRSGAKNPAQITSFYPTRKKPRQKIVNTIR